MSDLSRMRRLSTVAVLMAAAVFVAPNAAAAGVTGPPGGIEPKTMATVCAQLKGEFFHADRRSPYPYGCGVPDGDINCRETTECAYRGAGDVPPMEETCGRAGGLYAHDALMFVCSLKMYAVEVVICDPTSDVLPLFIFPNEQPMPVPVPVVCPIPTA